LTYLSPKAATVPASPLVPAGRGNAQGCFSCIRLMANQLVSIFSMRRWFSRKRVVLPSGRRAPCLSAPVQILFFTFTEKDRDAIVQFVVDFRRGVDLLSSRSDVDGNESDLLGTVWSSVVEFEGEEANESVRADRGATRLTSLLCTLREPGTDQLRCQECFMAYLQMMTAPIQRRRCFFRVPDVISLFHPEDAAPFNQAASDPKELKWYDVESCAE
jgi:hypothetical protein